MESDFAPLPRDPDILIGIIDELRDENSTLRAMLETLKRALYGARSERFGADAAQLALGLGDVSTTPVELEQEAARPRPQDQPTRPKAARNIGALPKHLPREDVVIEPTICTCPCCQGKLHRIGEDVSEMLDVVPAIVQSCRRRRHPVRSRAACRRRHCSRTLRSRSLRGTCRCIAKHRCSRATALIWIGPRWCIGSSARRGG